MDQEFGCGFRLCALALILVHSSNFRLAISDLNRSSLNKYTYLFKLEVCERQQFVDLVIHVLTRDARQLRVDCLEPVRAIR